MNKWDRYLFLLAILLVGRFDGTMLHAVTPLKMERDPGAVVEIAPAKIRKVAGIVKTMDNAALVLKNGKKYSLAGVRVITFGKGSAAQSTGRVADMTFVNERLVEVAIR